MGMGRIAGIAEAEDRVIAAGTAVAMLGAIGIEDASGFRGFAASDPDQIATLGPYHLVLDGILYNAEELPQPAGQGPKPTSDAARILAGIDRYGLLGALARINGDFAVALYDERTRAITLARDRFGVRPLYHTGPGLPVAFASRPRSLLQVSGVSREPDPKFLMAAAATHYRFIDTEPLRSPFRDIVQVPAGHTVTLVDGGIRRTRFGDIVAGPKPGGTDKDQAEEYLDLLRNAVDSRLRRANKPVFTLSGGLDSSTVASLANRITGSPPRAISSVHRDEAYDERKEIMDVVNAGLVEWQPFEIDDPDLFNVIAKLSGFHDQPIPTVTWMSHYLLAERIADMGYGSVFGGLGGDEQHAGEYDYFFYFFADLKAAGRTDQLDREIGAWVRNHDHPVFNKSGDVAARTMAMLTDPEHPGLCRANTHLLQRYGRLLNPDLGSLDVLLPQYEATSGSYLTAHMRNELLFNTMPCCLRAGDRNTAALGLQEFHPFLDWRLFEFMLALPGDRKIRNGMTKSFAREAYKGLLPEATRVRVTKTGWNAPAHQWFTGAGRETLLDMVSSRRFIERGIYDNTTLRALIDEHEEIVNHPGGREDHMMVLWQVVTLELWLQSLDYIPAVDKGSA
jgi:asparagine synthase (glutamine-hydrolysing)